MTLKQALDRAVRKEDYLRAAKLRDKIAKHGEDAELPTRMKEPVRLQTRTPVALPVNRNLFSTDPREFLSKPKPSKRRTRPARELMAERHAAVMEELSARVATVQHMTGERVYPWDVVRIADMRGYYEEFILDGVCILRVQHFDERFYL